MTVCSHQVAAWSQEMKTLTSSVLMRKVRKRTGGTKALNKFRHISGKAKPALTVKERLWLKMTGVRLRPVLQLTRSSGAL